MDKIIEMIDKYKNQINRRQEIVSIIMISLVLDKILLNDPVSDISLFRLLELNKKGTMDILLPLSFITWYIFAVYISKSVLLEKHWIGSDNLYGKIYKSMIYMSWIWLTFVIVSDKSKILNLLKNPNWFHWIIFIIPLFLLIAFDILGITLGTIKFIFGN